MPPIVTNKADADTAVGRAHAAFRSTANRRMRSLLAVGVESDAASSQLLDDLIVPRDLADAPPNRAAPLQSSSSSGGGSSGAGGGSAGGGSPSLQHVVACTGTSPAQAKKILLLREEISRLRRDGHSTATVIEQLRGRLRDVREPQPQGWSDEEGENAEVGGGSWKEVKGGAAAAAASKKRRLGASDDAGIDLSSGKEYAALPENTHPHDRSPLGGAHHLEFAAGAPPGGRVPGYCADQLGDLEFSPARGLAATMQPSDKRLREEERATPLSQLKKLKLRAQAEG